MDQPNSLQKTVTLLLMLTAMAATAFFTYQYLPRLLRLAISYTNDRTMLIGWISGYFLAACFVVWAAIWLAAGLVQWRWRVWGGFAFLPLLIIGVIGANAAAVYGPRFLTETSEQAEMDQLMDQAQHQLANDIRAFQGELKALGYPRFLQPFIFGQPGELTHSLAKIKKARAIVAEYSSHRAALMAMIRERIRNLKVSEVNKIEALTKLDAQLRQSEDDRARVWQMQDKIMAEYQAMLEDVAKAKGRWNFDGYNVNFARKQDDDIFNGHLSRAKALADEARLLNLKLAQQK